MGLYSSIAVDLAGNAYIVYYDSIFGNLKFARQVLGDWQIGTIAFSGDVGRYNSIAVDSAGRVHVSYYDATEGYGEGCFIPPAWQEGLGGCQAVELWRSARPLRSAAD